MSETVAREIMIVWINIVYNLLVFCVFLDTSFIDQKTTSNNTKTFVHILVNFFSCVLT